MNILAIVNFSLFQKSSLLPGSTVFVFPDETCLIDIMDTVGLEEYSAMLCYGTGEGFLLVFALDNDNSFEKISHFWQDITKIKVTMPFHKVLFFHLL